MKKKRYIAQLSVYVYADNDTEAKIEANKLSTKIKEIDANECSVGEVGLQPFGTFNYKVID